jgi:hypothetical protein
VQNWIGVSQQQTLAALKALAEAGVIRQLSAGTYDRQYAATELFDLLTAYEEGSSARHAARALRCRAAWELPWAVASVLTREFTAARRPTWAITLRTWSKSRWRDRTAHAPRERSHRGLADAEPVGRRDRAGPDVDPHDLELAARRP